MLVFPLEVKSEIQSMEITLGQQLLQRPPKRNLTPDRSFRNARDSLSELNLRENRVTGEHHRRKLKQRPCGGPNGARSIARALNLIFGLKLLDAG